MELRDEELNVKKIIAVINASFAVAKRKPGKNSGLYRVQTLDLCSTSAASKPTGKIM